MVRLRVDPDFFSHFPFLFLSSCEWYNKKNLKKKQVNVKPDHVNATGLEPTTTELVNEHSTFWLNV